MSRSLSLTALQVNALTTSNDTILYNAQARDISLYGGTDLAGTITQLEINNLAGDCLTLRHNSSNNNYSNFTLSSSGTLNLNVNNGDKSFNIVNHNGSTTGLKLAGVLVTATAAEINQLSGLSAAFDNLDYLDGVTAGTALAGKALITDSNNNISGINHLYTQDLTVNGVLVTATATELNYTDITTAGTAQPAKALVVDTNKDIVSIRNLSATNLTGTLQTASQPNITTIGTLANLTVTSQITVGTLDADAILVDGVDITTAISGSDPTTGITPGTVTASKVLLVDMNKNLTGMGNLTSTGTITASTLTGTLSTASQPNVTTLGGVTSIGASGSTTLTGTLQTAAQTNVTSVGTLTGLVSNGNVDIAQHNGSTTGLKIAGTLITATAADLNKLPNITATATEINKVAGVTPGTVTASKALIVDANKDLSSIRNLTLAGSLTGASTVSATTLTGTLSTASQPNITSVGTLGDLTVTNQVNAATVSTDSVILGGNDITSSLSNIGNLGGVTAGTVSASKVLLVDASRNLTNMGNLTSTGTLSATTLTGTLSTAAQTAITSVGNLTNLTIAANGNLTMSGTGALTGAATVSATTLTGALSTATQTAITSVGNLTNLTIAANGNLTMSGTGTLTGAATVSATTLTGTLSTAAQTSVTSLGTLTGLSSNGNVDIAQHDGSTKGLKLSGTLVTAIASELNTLAGVTAGTVTANKALVVDTNKDLSSIRNLTLAGTLTGATTVSATTLTGTLSTTSQPNITTLAGVTSIGASNSTTLTGVLQTAAQPNITSIGSLTGLIVFGTISGVSTLTASNIGGTITTASQPSITTLGGVTSIGASSSTTLTGTLQTAAQTNITSVGTLTSLALSGAISGVTTLTATTLAGTLSTASQPNITTLAGVTSIGASGSTTLTGVLQTASQPNVTTLNNVTSIGTLTSLTLSGGLSGTTTISSSGAFTNTLSTASTTNTTGALILSGGIGISNITDATSSTNGGTFTTAGGMAIAKSLYVGTNLTVGGNLTISGTTTTINSTTTNITDNTLILNSGPAGTGYDAGILTQRFQNNNAAGTGDVVNDTAKATFALATGSTTTTLILPSDASSVDNFYTNWWVKITSGTQNNLVRQITNYVGSTRTATLNTVLSGSPALGNTINLYNKGYTSIFWNESNKGFATAFVSSDGSSTLNIIDYADMAMNNIIGFSTTTSTSSTTGALTLAGGIGISDATDATSSTNGGTFTTAGGAAIAKSLRVGTSINGQSLVLSGGISGVTTISSSGAFTNTLSTASTSNTTGALILSGGIGISNTTDATNSTNGGSFTTAGGMAIARKLHIGGNIYMTNTLASSQCFVNFLTDTQNWEIGGRGSTAALPNSLYIYNGAFLMSMTPTGVTSFSNSTASTSNTTGALILSGGIGISNTTDATSSTNGGSFTTAGGMAIARSLRVGTSITSSGLITATTLNLGTATDNTFGKMLNVLDSAMSGATRYITLGKLMSNNNQFEIGFNHISDGSASNSASFGFYGQASRAITIIASGQISISNTSDSSSSTTGALQCAGGAYFGGTTLLGSQTQSTSATTGALTISGGIGIARNAWIGNGITLSAQSTVKISTTAPTSYMSLNDSPIYFRSTSASDKNHFISFCGALSQTSWNTGKGFANPSTANDGPVLCGNANVIIGTMAGGSTETICGNFTSTGLTLAGNGISCPNPGYTLDFASNAQNMQISLFNGTFGIGACNTNLQFFSGVGHAWYTTGLTAVQKNALALSGPTTLMTLSSSGALAGTSSISTGSISASSSITSSSNMSASYHYSTTSTSTATYVSNWPSASFWGLGAESSSADSTVRLGICSSAGAWSGYANFKCGNISSTSRISMSNDGYGFSHYSGSGVEVITKSNGNSDGAVGTFSNHTFNIITNNVNRIIVDTSGNVGIGGSPSYPLDVTGTGRCKDRLIIGNGSNQLSNNVYPFTITSWCTSTQNSTNVGGGDSQWRIRNTDSGSYNTGGSTSSNTWGNCSARINDIVVAPTFIAISDRRIKTNIREISDNFCKEFVMSCTPVCYNFKRDLRQGRDNTQFGYIAQELEQQGFAHLVTHLDDPDNEDLVETTETIDGKIYKSPEGVKLSVSYQEITPLLAQNIKVLYIENENKQNKIDLLEQKNKDLEDRLAKIEQFINTLELSE